MQQRYFGRLITHNPQQFVVNLSGTPEQSLCKIMPTLDCTCGLKKQIEVVVSACLLKLQKLREERTYYKSLYKEERAKVEKLREDIKDWENNYCHMRKAAMKRAEFQFPDSNSLMTRNFTLQNTIKELNIKLSRERTRNRIITQSQNLDLYLNELKYSNTTMGKEEDSFLLDTLKKPLSPAKQNLNIPKPHQK